MKTDRTLLKKRTKLAGVVLAFLLVGLIGFLLCKNYVSMAKLRDSALNQLYYDAEKLGIAVSYFYSERKDDLKDLAESRELSVFFENKALGMSMDYGLRASLIALSKKFDRLLNEKKFNDKKIYSRIVFINAGGGLLVDCPALNTPAGKIEKDWVKYLAPNKSDPTIIAEHCGELLQIAVSVSYFFKNRYMGQILAWVSPGPVCKLLIQTDRGSSSRLHGIVCQKGMLHLTIKGDSLAPYPAHFNFGKVKSRKPYRFEATYKNGAKLDTIAVRIPVKDTPFSLAMIVPASEVFGNVSPWHLSLIMGILSVMIMGAMVNLWRINTRNEVLLARIEEANRREHDIREKNLQLEKEIAERKQIEDALQQVKGELEIRVAERTRELDDANIQLQEELVEKKRTELALRESEEKYRTFFETSRDCVFITSNDGRWINFNDLAVEFFGFENRDELRKIKITEHYEDSESRKKHIEAIEQKGFLRDFAVNLRKKDGSIINTLITSVVRKDENGNIIGYQGTIKDVTERKQLEAQLLQAQKMEAVGTLAGGIAHDFNNILQAVSGYCQLLLMRKEDNDPDRNYLCQIDGSIQRAAELIRHLLLFSRKVESKLRPVDLNSKIVLVHEILIKAVPRMVNIELCLTDDLKTINADPIQLEQIIMNLAVNARDAMPDGGRLVIETENAVLDEEYCKIHLGATPGEHVLLVISDTGHGMEKETLEHIFEPFYTTKEAGRGTGLGLATVYGIVKNHGGYIMCYSEPDEGTTFRIYFPVLKTAVIVDDEAAKSEKVEEMLEGGDETILLVDDEETILDISSSMLGQYGYDIIEARSGEEAVEIYEKEKDRIDLVILDVGMPGMGGHKCLRRLLEIDPAAGVIIASGYSSDGRVRETLEAGAAGFIGKPYHLVNLLKKVREVLGGDVIALSSH